MPAWQQQGQAGGQRDASGWRKRAAAAAAAPAVDACGCRRECNSAHSLTSCFRCKRAGLLGAARKPCGPACSMAEQWAIWPSGVQQANLAREDSEGVPGCPFASTRLPPAVLAAGPPVPDAMAHTRGLRWYLRLIRPSHCLQAGHLHVKHPELGGEGALQAGIELKRHRHGWVAQAPRRLACMAGLVEHTPKCGGTPRHCAREQLLACCV